MFKGILINKDDDGYHCNMVELVDSQLPRGDVTVDVDYSTLNYKDGLAITGISPVVRQFPMIPGIDFAGRVAHSSHPDYQAGDKVVLNGWGVGEKHWGGLSQRARVNGDWLVPLPDSFSERQAMSIGTAGYTAMLCVMALEEQGVTPDSGDIIVTGAGGGVGSVAISILSKLGYNILAVSGRSDESDYIMGLGASEIIPRDELSGPGRPLGKERWAGAVDVVGSNVLANVCAGAKYGGVVTACGLAGGMDFPSTVAPFILRGVRLIGIDSVMCPREKRLIAWERLGRDLDPAKLEMIAYEVGLSDAISTAHKLLEGKLRGRVIVDVNK